MGNVLSAEEQVVHYCCYYYYTAALLGLLYAQIWLKIIFEELHSDGEKKICWSVALLTGREEEPWGPGAGEGMLWGGDAPEGTLGSQR